MDLIQAEKKRYFTVTGGYTMGRDNLPELKNDWPMYVEADGGRIESIGAKK
jgi:hypothetical protein